MNESKNNIHPEKIPPDPMEVAEYVEAALAGDPEVRGLIFGDQMRSPEAEVAYWTIRRLAHNGRQPKQDISKWL